MLASSTNKYNLGLPVFWEVLLGFMGINAAPDTASNMPMLWNRDNVSPRNTKAIIVVDLFGNMANWKELQKI